MGVCACAQLCSKETQPAGAHDGHLDGMGQRRPIQDVVKMYLQNCDFKWTNTPPSSKAVSGIFAGRNTGYWPSSFLIPSNLKSQPGSNPLDMSTIYQACLGVCVCVCMYVFSSAHART